MITLGQDPGRPVRSREMCCMCRCSLVDDGLKGPSPAPGGTSDLPVSVRVVVSRSAEPELGHTLGLPDFSGDIDPGPEEPFLRSGSILAWPVCWWPCFGIREALSELWRGVRDSLDAIEENLKRFPGSPKLGCTYLIALVVWIRETECTGRGQTCWTLLVAFVRARRDPFRVREGSWSSPMCWVRWILNPGISRRNPVQCLYDRSSGTWLPGLWHVRGYPHWHWLVPGHDSFRPRQRGMCPFRTTPGFVVPLSISYGMAGARLFIADDMISCIMWVPVCLVARGFGAQGVVRGG